MNSPKSNSTQSNSTQKYFPNKNRANAIRPYGDKIYKKRMMANKYNPDIHHRRSIRLTGHDYSQSGLYFITLCTIDRTCMFGNVAEGKMQLNDIGQLVEQEWLNTINIRHNDVRLHNYIVMPNHFHAIIEIRRGESHSPK